VPRRPVGYRETATCLAAIACEDPTGAGLRADQLAATTRNARPFLTRDAAEEELGEILEDEPDWADVLHVGRHPSAP
jgi:hypothetical protein